MSPRSMFPGNDPSQNEPTEADKSIPTSPSRPRTIRWASNLGTALAILGTIGAVLGFLLFFDEDPTAAATLSSGVMLLVSGVIINVLIEIWEKIPEPNTQ